MKKILILAFIALSVRVCAQDGIKFDHISWSEAKAKAISEKKLIFIDFYTQWCGPCLNMAENVFTSESVGSFYNSNFINLKIDAEHGEGIELAKQYGVACYPTFAFVDPSNEKLVHESSSRQDKATFIFTGKSALDPTKTSVYFKEQVTKGNTTPSFLLSYANYCASRYMQSEVDKIVKDLALNPDYSLNNKDVWTFFNGFLTGYKNPYFQMLVKDYSHFAELYGKETVDAKLYKELNFCMDESILSAAPDFKGKSFLLVKNKAEQLIRQEKYEQAAAIIDELLVSPKDYQEAICQFLEFNTRFALKGGTTDFWKKKCIEYVRYVAYNHPNRDYANVHYTYAALLEQLITSDPEAAKRLPKEIVQKPKYGNAEYTMRSPKLAPKNIGKKVPKK